MTDAVTERPAPPPSVHTAQAPSRRDEIRRLVSLTWTLALSDWKLRFYGSFLGLAWTLVRPFALFGVVYFVFTEIAGLDASVKNYGVYILFGLVLFTFFGEMTSNSVNALVTREGLLRKMQFNPIVIPLSISITALLNLAMTLIAVFIFCLGNRIYPAWSWLQFPVIVLLLFLLGTGVGMLLSVLYVRFRDVSPIWDVLMQILFYGSAVLYVAVPTVPAEYRQGFLCNPLAALFTQVRHAVIDPGAPSITSAFNESYYVLIPLGLTLGTFVLGLWFFLRESPRVAENL